MIYNSDLLSWREKYPNVFLQWGNGDHQLVAPPKWQNRRISPDWTASILMIDEQFLIVDHHGCQQAHRHDWERFTKDLTSFKSSLSSPKGGWIEIWNFLSSQPEFNPDTRPLISNYMKSQNGDVRDWLFVSQTPMDHMNDPHQEQHITYERYPTLECALKRAQSQQQNFLKIYHKAKKNHHVYAHRQTLVIWEQIEERGYFHFYGSLRSQEIPNLSSWIQVILMEKKENISHHIELKHLKADDPIAENEIYDLANDLQQIYPHLKADKVKSPLTPSPKDLGEVSDHQQQLIDLLRKDVIFLQKKNERMENIIQKEKRQTKLAIDSKSDFLNVINHELRTPLNGVIGMLDLLKTTKLEEEQEEFLDLASQSAGKLHELVTTLLEYANLDLGNHQLEHQPLNPNDLIQDCLDEYHDKITEKGLELHSHLLNNPIVVMGDIQRLQQITNELLNNALNNTEKGSISLRSTILSEDKKSIMLKVEVSDTGAGIEPEKLEMIFKDFSQADMSTTRKIGGTGVGLSLCKKLSHMMKGRMGVYSEVGEGSRFWFIVNLDKIQEKENSTNALHKEAQLKGRQALLIDDNPITRKVMSKALRDLELTVDVTGNGFTGLELAKTQNFDLIFFNLSQPELDSTQFKEDIDRHHLKKGDTAPPIIGLSRHVHAELIMKCSDAGMAGVLGKPLKTEELNALLHQLYSE